jgi:hypothetical protein
MKNKFQKLPNAIRFAIVASLIISSAILALLLSSKINKLGTLLKEKFGTRECQISERDPKDIKQ